MPNLDPLLHQELRLSIISYLVGVDSADFKKLMEVTKASKGNLSVQISKLSDAGFLKVKKSFRGKYPHTECKITSEGQQAFEAYVQQLKKMLNI